MNHTLLKILLPFLLFLSGLSAQEVDIQNYSTNVNGQVELDIEAKADHYYILQVRHAPSGDFEWSTSLTIGEEGTMTISEPLKAYPLEHYRVLEYPDISPIDSDGDGEDDIIEFYDMPTQGPFNYAAPIDLNDGSVTVDEQTTFKELSISGIDVPWAPFLDDQEFVKFVIVDLNSNKPELYFINSETHYIHQDFMDEVGISIFDDVITGEIVFHPTVVADNGTLGVYSFNYSFGFGEPFSTVQKCHEFIALNMPYLKNNLSYFVTSDSEFQYFNEKDKFDDSRVPILFEDEVYADIDYLALNVSEGFGLFRLMDLEETPNSKDIVLYESLPNTLPRVGGIITSFIQTPLSHVNLRAIQDNVPNAFIRDPLAIDSINNLLGKYIYYRADQDEYYIREATLEEVNDWYEDIRPDEEQIPALNLDYTDILPLDDIDFNMSDGFGAKCTNVATMRTFGFPEGTLPNGFGIPFYYYQEFMKYNGFFDEIQTMLDNPDFQSDLDTRIDMLKELRKSIRDADMPQWMLDDLQEMHDAFPAGTAVRCRSSTNNEDLPGFSGAGLYTSKTQHLDEGHISKSIKQVYASMWNFRAFDERDFYRIDQFAASMGVLCHPNYSDEKANGVGVSTDPIYQTDHTFYLNTQLGEDLVTNPDALSIPEEILLDQVSVTEDDYVVIRYSNLVDNNELIMTEFYLDEMRDFMQVIHDEFQKLYEVEGNDDFAVDIEYKITSEDQLIIKQARPWASFWIDLSTNTEDLEEIAIDLVLFPNPVQDAFYINCDCSADRVYIRNMLGQVVQQEAFRSNTNGQIINVQGLTSGVYFVQVANPSNQILSTRKIIVK